jgi:hypothetical protein
MNSDAWRAVTAFAVVAAAATCFAAVSMHALDVQSGYSLARAQREARVLDRDLCEAEQAVATARSPAVLRATALALGLDIEYPSFMPDLRGEDVQFHRRAFDVEQAVVVKADAR